MQRRQLLRAGLAGPALVVLPAIARAQAVEKP